ncbi:Ubiquitin carboxyl-terminal hydrolase 8 [Tulasnella sp. JGI-2019a]|nr:Ubiquitin carboxyl-terminal hydrolase 8 [Tulasnella sp. JGI-2019a]
MESTTYTATTLATELATAVLTAVLKVLAGLKSAGLIVWHELFAPGDDDRLLIAVEAGTRQVNERTPLLPSPRTSKMPTLAEAAQLYSAHVEIATAAMKQRRLSDSYSATASGSGSGSTRVSSPMPATPGASYSEITTPEESAPGTPTSQSSYFTVREPLYVSDVSLALEREYRKQTSTPPIAFQRAPESGAPSPPPASPIVRKLSAPNHRLFTDDTSYLTASLLCLLHSRDLHEFFLSGRYLDEVEDADGQHQAVINAFASTAQFFWPTEFYQSVTQQSPLLDLSIFHALFKKLNGPRPSLTTTTGNNNNVVQHLLRSLHVALNDGEYCSDQPTYSRTPLALDSEGGDENDLAMRRHVDSLRNMQAIQEDSIVKDLFEGLTCITSRCQTCDSTSASFESFRVLQVPKPMRPYTTLHELLENFEKPSTSRSGYCGPCGKRQPVVESSKLWSLPAVLIIQLAASSTSPSSSPEALTQTPSGSPPLISSIYAARRRSFTTTKPDYFSVLPSQIDYPITGLDMSIYDRDQARPGHHDASTSSSSIETDRQGLSASPASSYSGSGSDDECDLNSMSDATDRSGGETAMYDLFSVRERSPGVSGWKSPGGAIKYRTYAQDPVKEDWKLFDGGDVSPVGNMSDLVTPNADMLFYRRRS